ncbi:MAG: hypothetical protein ACOYOU_03065 [Kiritimatiellia bacterium]
MSTATRTIKPFPLGQLVATPGALDAISRAGQSPLEILLRHAANDWGEVGNEDWQANDEALGNGERLLSAYTLANGEKIWIITEHDRSVTTVLLPDEY